MFEFYKSLKKIDLSNFNTQNVTNMSGMFSICDSLNKENIITKDEKIISNYIINN